ncbi:MAG TPA: lysophospholipid acyltransferase family protein [Vicinamibacteria bacterium]|nr:lysophospholipid acyltransferase family protein [Vicinamibacteria bacterium]
MTRLKHWAEHLAAFNVSLLVGILPRRMRLGIGRALGSLVFAIDRRHRAITLDNVRTAFGDRKTDEERLRVARGAFQHFGAMLVELLTLGARKPAEIESLVEMEGTECFERARRRGRGVILVAAHFGNWELHAIAHGFRFGPIHLVARELDNAYLNRKLEKLRRVSGNGVIYKKQALRQMRRLMKAGETVAFVIDQNVHLQDAVFVEFFGKKAATTPVASWFAITSGAALVPVFCYPLPDGRYRAVYEAAIDAERFRELPRAEALQKLTQELVTVQERYIRERPEIWLWMHRRWRTRPPRAVARPIEDPVVATELR